MTSLLPRRPGKLGVTLHNCDSEPVHSPGTIQGFGAIVVLEKLTSRVLQASENCASFLLVSPHNILGAHFLDALQPALRLALQPLFTDHGLPLSAHPDLRPCAIPVLEGRPACLASMRACTADSVLLEIEIDLNRKPLEVYDFISLSQSLNDSSAPTLTNSLVSAVRSLTGFDRALLLRFDDDWNGQVVACDQRDDLVSFANHWFPAGDIPAPARALYLTNPTRLIVDVRARQMRMLALESQPAQGALDFSESMCRGVSPIHLEYLRNMNVEASFSVAIIRNDSLWGLIACHHFTPRHVPGDARQAVVFLGSYFINKLVNLEKKAQLKTLALNQDALVSVCETFARATSMNDGLEQSAPLLMKIFGAAGMALVSENGTATSWGACPSDKILSAIIPFLKSTVPDPFFATNCLAHHLDQFKFHAAEFGGLLGIATDSLRTQWILWFRTTHSEEILWGGNPHKNESDVKEPGRIYPRKSFETWRQSVMFQSADWNESDMATARTISAVSAVAAAKTLLSC